MLQTNDTPESHPLLETKVPAEGEPSWARFAIVGEAPSYAEELEKRPFVGPSGNILTRILNVVGLPRHELYITNVCKTKLKNNNPKELAPVWNTLQYNLLQELASLKTDYIILMGETAMKAVLSEGRFDAVGKYQGSIYRAEDFPHLKDLLPGKHFLVTFHPASALPQNKPTNFYLIMHDIQKFIDLEKKPSLLDISNTVHIKPTYYEAVDFLESLKSCKETSFDIEATPEFVTCLGFTRGPHEAMCIPFLTESGSYFSMEQEVHLWTLIAEVLASPSVGKIMQNGMFDIMFLLRAMNIKTENFTFDTMIARHLCWTDLRKGLDAIVSCYTYYPYHKDDGKQIKLGQIKDWVGHWEYNAKDCLYTHQVVQPLKNDLSRLGATDAFEYSMTLHKPLMEMEYRGMQMDIEGVRLQRDKLYKYVNALQAALNRIAGKSINVRSAPQMKEYFYDELKIKPYVNRKTSKPTLDDMALKRIARAKKKGYREAKLVIKIRKLAKLISNYFELELDADQRLRCSYNITGTKTGRLSSSGTFFGTGTNLQNLPPAIKKYILPDSGYLLIELDLSQAEARVVAYASGDANMIASFESGIDCHSYNACQIFNRELDEFIHALHSHEPKAKQQRKLAKKIVHASNYAMGYKLFALEIEEPENVAKSLLEAYHTRFPGIRKWHRQIDQQIQATRVLTNLHGRPKRFLGIINHDLLKSAYAYVPQSTVAEQLNRGMVRISEDPSFSKWDTHLIGTVHDSVLLQAKIDTPQELQELLLKCSSHLDKPLYVNGRSFNIPCDAKISYTSWGVMHEIDNFDLDTVRASYERAQTR